MSCGHGRDLIAEAPHKSNPLRSLRIKRIGSPSRYIGLELKRLLGVIWIRIRLLELMSAMPTVVGYPPYLGPLDLREVL